MNSTNARPLTDEQVQEFNERGLLLLDTDFTMPVLDAIVTKVEPLYDQNMLRDRISGNRVQDGWKQVDEVRQLATDKTILAVLAQLYGRRPLPFQTLNFPIGTCQRAHSDVIHFSSLPHGYMAGVWIALEDIDEDNGALIYYPGSHKLKYHSMQSLGLGAGYKNYPDYEEKIQQLIEEEKLEPELGPMKKGQALIWAANLLHGGSEHKDRSRSRHSQVTHYYFEACKYYTPMGSTVLKKLYRQPQWIPETADYKLPGPVRVPFSARLSRLLRLVR